MSERATAPRPLEPSAVQAIIEAFEGAIDALRADGRLSEEARADLTRTIIEHAETGLLDPAELKNAALERFGLRR